MKIGILGLGTVGGGVVNVLRKNSNSIERRTGVKIQMPHAAVKSVNEPRICDDGDINITEDAFEVVNNPEIDVVLELIGGTTIAKELVIAAINNNKHVITANKALIATHGNELLALAKEKNVHLLFEAAVAGGIPILKSLEQGLSANKIELVAGIINGTGNFILSEMKEKGRDFADVLAEAQALGYAEADPTFDIEGIYTGSIFLKSNQTTSVETGKINPSLKFKDNFGGLALLSDWFRAKFYHILRNNPASFSINGIAVMMFTE